MAKELEIVAASYRRGFTGRDHLLDDDDFRPIVGRIFSSEAKAYAAAEKLKRSGAPVSLVLVAPKEPTSDYSGVTRVAVSWIGSIHDGYYDAEVWAGDQQLDGPSNPLFPVGVRDREYGYTDELRRELRRAFPRAEIDIR
jgi:hypothetical protein